MGYSIEFEPNALKDWRRLQPLPRERFKKMLAKRLDYPRIASSLVSGYDGNVYRLKLSSEGLRLIYVVLEVEEIIYVIAVGKRQDLAAYKTARGILG